MIYLQLTFHRWIIFLITLFYLTSSLTINNFIGRVYHDFPLSLQGHQVRKASSQGRSPVWNQKKHTSEIRPLTFTITHRLTHLMSIISDEKESDNLSLKIKGKSIVRKVKTKNSTAPNELQLQQSQQQQQQPSSLKHSSKVNESINKKTRKKSSKNNTNGTTFSKVMTRKTTAKTQKSNTTIANTNSSNISSPQDYYWIDSRDCVVVDSSMDQRMFHCTIRGPPQPLKRHRSGNQGFQRRHMYNPSAVAQRSFQKAIRNCCNIRHDDVNQSPLLQDKDDHHHQASHDEATFLFSGPIRMTLHFYMPRPKSHYRNHQPGRGRLKQNAPMLVQRKVDVDNLAKFVLDSLNGILYEDDHQIVSLYCSKCYDDDDDDDDDDDNCSDDNILPPPIDNMLTETCGKTVLWLQSLSSFQDIRGCMDPPRKFQFGR
jgi:Holliday junction resolvase RusA-like endonuclease